MKFEPLNAADYADTIIYKRFMPAGTAKERLFKNGNLPKRRRYADVLNEFGGHLFKNFDCFNITEQQLLTLNNLLKRTFQFIQKYIPKQQASNVRLNTLYPYLCLALNKIYTRTTKSIIVETTENGKKVKKSRFDIEKENQDKYCYGQPVRFYQPKANRTQINEEDCSRWVALNSDICPSGYVAKTLMSISRKPFKAKHGLYPEDLFIAVTFYLMPYAVGIKPTQNPKFLTDMLVSLTKEIKSTLHHQQCGKNQKKSWQIGLEDKYNQFEQDMLSGKYKDDKSIQIKSKLAPLPYRRRDAFISRFNETHHLKRITDFNKKTPKP